MKMAMKNPLIAMTLFCLLGSQPAALAAAGEDNLHFHGILVAEPCVIPPGEESIILDLGTIVDKYLYQNQRTKGKSFEIHLTECDLSIAKSVSISFTGTESTALPGLLAPDTGGELGIAIGLETADGLPQRLNQPGQPVLLVSGDNRIKFNGYVQGEPQALANNSIGYGVFSASATFKLNYE